MTEPLQHEELERAVDVIWAAKRQGYDTVEIKSDFVLRLIDQLKADPTRKTVSREEVKARVLEAMDAGVSELRFATHDVIAGHAADDILSLIQKEVSLG